MPITGVGGQTGSGVGSSSSVLPSVSTIPGIPSWMVTDLNQLAAQNQLSGVPPVILGLIALEESGFEKAGAGRFYGALLMGAGGLIGLVGLGLVVVGALAETKLGRTTERAFGAAGLGTVVGAAAAPGRAVQGRRQAGRERAEGQQRQQEAAQRRQASEAHQAAVRRAQLRTQRARARRAEESVRTQRAITQGRDDSAIIRSYERNEGAERRREAVESRRAGRSLAAQNRRRIAQRQKFDDVFGERSA